MDDINEEQGLEKMGEGLGKVRKRT